MKQIKIDSMQDLYQKRIQSVFHIITYIAYIAKVVSKATEKRDDPTVCSTV